MGEAQEEAFQLSFNGGLRVDFQGSRVTSDGGLLVVRELDERLGLGAVIARHLRDSRGKSTQLPLIDLVRQSVYTRLASYEDVNDAERLSQDPAFRLIGSRKVLERGAALTSRLHSFETEILTQVEKLAGLARLNRELIARAEAHEPRRRVCWTRTQPRLQSSASKSRAPTTATSSLRVITRCCCSMTEVTGWV